MITIGVDVDGVMANVHEKIDREWMLHNLRISHASDVVDFDYAKCVGEEAKKIAYEVFRRPRLYDNMNLSVPAQEVLKALRSEARVVAVTSPFAEHAESKIQFCQRAGFDFHDIFLCHDKHLLRLDVLVDDKAETLIEPPYPGVLFDQPWNRWLKHPRRALGWSGVLKQVDLALAGR